MQQKKFIYQMYIEAYKCTLEEHLKLLLDYDMTQSVWHLSSVRHHRSQNEYVSSPPENSLGLDRFDRLRKLYVMIALSCRGPVFHFSRDLWNPRFLRHRFYGRCKASSCQTNKQTTEIKNAINIILTFSLHSDSCIKILLLVW